MRRAVTLGLLSVIGSSACSNPTYFEDVKPILDGRCVRCHQAGAIAPFPLDNYGDAEAHAEDIAAQVADRAMPPWLAGPADVTYRRDPTLTDEQIELIREWSDAGAPAGDKADEGAPLTPLGGGSRVDVAITMEEAYTPAPAHDAHDDYRCFPIHWPETADTFVTGFNARPGAPRQVHHIAVYRIPPEHGDKPFDWDLEEEGPGYTCFGGPFGAHEQFATVVLAAWVPGNEGLSLDGGLGIPVSPGSTLVLQVHYSVPEEGAVADLTTLEFQIEPIVAKPAIYAPFLNIAWVLGTMDIAADGMTEHTYRQDPRSTFPLFMSDISFPNGFDVHAVLFHMHTRGASGQVLLHHPDGTSQRILDIPRWDFHWQQEYHLQTAAAFREGDELEITCRWDNGGREATNWGEASDKEMCVANLLISPAN